MIFPDYNYRYREYKIDAVILPKVLNVLELVKQFADGKNCRRKKQLQDVYYNEVQKDLHKSVTKNGTGKRCHDLVIKSIFSHHYEEAAKLYWILCHDKSILEHAIFKIGIILLLNLETKNQNDSFQSFFRSALNFGILNKRETLLEFIMCAFKCDFPDVQRQVKELASRMKHLSKLRKNDKIDSVYDAYILFLDWCKVFTGNINVVQSQTYNEIVKLRKYDEDSDIFILKLMKVLEFCNKQTEMESELLRYVESNPDNINALIYMCTYLYHNNPNSEKLIHYLEILAERCISDVRTLWLIEIWRKRGNSLLKILKYCFMFLDYPTNGRNIDAWKELRKNLKKAHQKMTEDEFEKVRLLWASRKRSWTWMYFNPQQLSNMQSDDKLIAYRVAFLLLIGEGSKYIKKVKENHPDIINLAESLMN